ncbi:MAG: hypothetical protein HDQ89_08345 [Desulfovibrio sp.]|nr:hypothetical protein [Desulfovibrio sp.]
MLLSVCIGVLSGAWFMARKVPSLTRTFLFKVTGKDRLLKHKHLVIYGESANYWGTFRPLLEEFGRRGEAVEYLTSTEDDPCFTADLPACITCRYIGKGNAAYTALNFLEADALVLTTPGVGVLQIRRSKGVGKYIHVLHSVGDIHYYKLFAFDYYDAVICNGDYQIKSLRTLEALRGTKPKELPIAGVPYLDGLVARREALGENTPDPNCVLIAPTWGKIGMFNRFGSAVPRILADAGFNVILRPHPQSYISDVKLMERMESELSGYKNITWDRNPDGFDSLRRAAVMVSDTSTVIFDLAFVFFRPVITLYEPNQDPGGFEAFDLHYTRWNAAVLSDIGIPLTTPDLERLPALVRRLAAETDWPERIRKVRDANVANFGCAAGPVVDAILDLTAKEGK